MRYRINRPDTGSKELIAYAKSIGFDYEHLGGSIDGALALGSRAILVEWKRADKSAELTPTQQRLVARGFPVRFVSRTEQLDEIKKEITSR